MLTPKPARWVCNNCACTKEGDTCDACYGHGCHCPCQGNEMPVDEILQLQKQADWERALGEYVHLREDIGRLEETGECSCEDFHTCSPCSQTAALDQRARALMNLWGDTWAMKLATSKQEVSG